MTMNKSVRLEILPENILVESKRRGQNSQPHNFRFPVALSPSLRWVFIMGTVIHILPVKSTQYPEEFVVSHLFDPRCPYAVEDDRLLQHPHCPKYPPALQEVDYYENLSSPDQRFHELLRCSFSPCERYMAILKGQEPPNFQIFFLTWILEIYLKVDENVTSTFQLVARSGVRLNGKASCITHLSR